MEMMPDKPAGAKEQRIKMQPHTAMEERALTEIHSLKCRSEALGGGSSDERAGAAERHPVISVVAQVISGFYHWWAVLQVQGRALIKAALVATTQHHKVIQTLSWRNVAGNVENFRGVGFIHQHSGSRDGTRVTAHRDVHIHVTEVLALQGKVLASSSVKA